jgi:hypothetical protein
MQNNQAATGQPVIYQFRIKGSLSSQWSEWFQGLSIIPTGDGDTFLTGPVADQAALFGLLRKVRDLGMPLLSFNRIGCDSLTDQGTGGTDAASIIKQEKGAIK